MYHAPWVLQCTSCPSGRYQNSAGQSWCTVCPGGYSCASASAAPAACAAGKFSLDGDGACSQCSAGSYQPSTAQTGCLPCPAGMYCGVSRCTLGACCITDISTFYMCRLLLLLAQIALLDFSVEAARPSVPCARLTRAAGPRLTAVTRALPATTVR
jgi:hypothetical protein